MQDTVSALGLQPIDLPELSEIVIDCNDVVMVDTGPASGEQFVEPVHSTTSTTVAVTSASEREVNPIESLRIKSVDEVRVTIP